ncbi:MAG TPA: glycogen debranching N-terminal domain-containing protein [Gemmatimonadales bacterium]|nr:glycogen debranching N-terminal domain-containing protein [Gemmatimonadales bacterium]
MTETIADAVVLKDGDVFLMFGPDGALPEGRKHGLGLYFHDCRYLRTYRLRVDSAIPTALGVTTVAGARGAIELSSRDTRSIEWSRVLDGRALTLTDVFTLHNWGREATQLEIELSFEAGFEDVFEVRGLLDEQLGSADPPEWRGRWLRFRYHGKDGVVRSLTIELPKEFAPRSGPSAGAKISLPPGAAHRVEVRLRVEESPRLERAEDVDDVGWPRRGTFSSDSLLLDEVLDRSFADLRLLGSTLHQRVFVAAGTPWFATLFGRDSLIAALQLLPYTPAVARDTLQLLAELQADHPDEYRDAEPGKILHEYRTGEMARTGAIPHSPYYGTVDATPLFLLVLGEYIAWTGDLDLFDRLRDNVTRALEWIDRWGDQDGDGYVEYRSRSEHGLINQGWKDSGDAIIDGAGRIATPPIALVEVQAYVYAAKLAIAGICARRGEAKLADSLREEAEALRARFDRDYWMDDLDCYALALEARKQPLRVVSSNAGHALWCGIAPPDKAARLAERLMAEDMFTGWGVRTLSATTRGYNPVGYHLGTVWPHDNAIIAAGLRRYGLNGAARRIADGIISAAADFDHRRLPELWTGFSRRQYGTPIRYPVACHPQAWAAGSVPFQLQHLLGLRPEAAERRLRIVRPVLPGLVGWLEVHGLKVGDASVDLRFEARPSAPEAHPRVDVLRVRGDLDVTVDRGEDR